MSAMVRPGPVLVNRSTWRGRALVPVLVSIGLLTAVVSSLGAPLVPTIASTYDVSFGTAQWSLTITLLVGAICAPVAGRLADGPRRRHVLLVCLGLLTLGSVLAALPIDVFALLLAGRGLQGVGLALLPVVMGVARDHLDPARARSTLATLSVTAAVGVGLGYPITGVIAEHLSFRDGFWMAAGLGAAAILLAALVVPTSQHAVGQPFDVVGAVTLAAGLLGLLVAISQGEEWGWTSPRLLIVVAVSVVILLGWGRYELRIPLPMMDLRLMKHRAILTANVGGILAGVTMYVVMSMIIRYVQTPTSISYGLGASVVVAGLVLLPLSVASTLASRVTIYLNRWISAAQVLPLGMLAFALGLALFAVSRSHLWEIFAVMGLVGIGVGCSFTVMPRMIVSAAPVERTSSALAMNQVVRTIGYSVGSALTGTILTAYTPVGAIYPRNAGYMVGAIVGIGLCLGTAALAFVLTATGRKNGPADGAEATSTLDADDELAVSESVDAALAGVIAFEPDRSERTDPVRPR